MQRECTLAKGMCKQMVTSAMPLSHHFKSENSKISINFFSKPQLQYKLWPYHFLLLLQIAYSLTRRSYNSHQVLTAVCELWLWCFRAGFHK